MTVPLFTLEATDHFILQASKLPDSVRAQLRKTLDHLARNPRHPALRTHKIKHARGSSGGDIFEAYVSDQYRMTWEYGDRGIIVLRNVDNHDVCLSRP